MAITPKKYARALCELAEKPDTDLQELASSFVVLLRKHHALNLLPGILMEVEEFYKKDKTLSMTAKIEYANYRNPSKELETELHKLYPGKSIRIEARKNPALIGGTKMIVDGQLIDATILGQLERASRKITR